MNYLCTTYQGRSICDNWLANEIDWYMILLCVVIGLVVFIVSEYFKR